MTILKKISTAVLAVLLILVALLLAFNVFLNIVFFDFFSGSRDMGELEGISDGFVHQGLDYVDGTFLTAGYMKEKGPSRIYRTKDGESLGYTELLKASGKAYTGHAGGITHFGDYLYVAGGTGFDVFPLADILNGEPTATCLGTVKSFNDPAWCTAYGGYIFGGSFACSDSASYAPEASEVMTAPDGSVNNSIITVFKLDENAELGIDPAPVAVISSGDKVQGACFTEDGNLILSTSWSFTVSKFCFYNLKDAVAEGTVTLGKTEDSDGVSVPLYYLDSRTRSYTLKSIPMAEEIIIVDGYMYIMNESASQKYKFGNLIGGRRFYAYEITDGHFEK